jgi:protein-S-isoprenylcysteine O-methyltransferase Ste14
VSKLELKIPPPIVALVVGAAMWALSRVTPVLAIHGVASTVAAVAIAIVGGGIGLAGNLAFHHAKTTANPFKPELASSLVTRGVYRITRNPMYLGLLLALVGWAVYLVSAWCLLGPVVFAAYVTEFQIKPEERILRSLFGDEYAKYASRVRRWV